MEDLKLSPELEAFAAEAIAGGRYRDMADLVRTGLDLVRQREAARTAFIASLEAAEEEADREGWLSLDEALQEIDRQIDDPGRRSHAGSRPD